MDAYCNPFAPLEPAAVGAASGGCSLSSACPGFDGAVASLVARSDQAIEYKGPMPL